MLKRLDSEKPEECPLVLIEWEDSAQPIPGWTYLSDFDKPNVISCASVGWLIHDGNSVKALAPNMGELGEAQNIQASGIIRIPTSCITRIVRLRETEEKALTSS